MPNQPNQAITPEMGQQILRRLLEARQVLQWVKNNDLSHLLQSDASIEVLSRRYATQLKVGREFLEQFEL